MKYIIMCGGQYILWRKPRHLLEINGETIVGRTVRQLKENGIEPYISTNDPRFEGIAPILRHENSYRATDKIVGGYWNECFYPTDEPVCYLMGDVVFSDEAIRKIVNTETDSIEFFASAPPFSPQYTKPYAEPFAFKVVDTEKFREAIRKTNELESLFKRKPIAWELWQVIKGHPLNVIKYDSYTVINDYTCDVDSPDDLAKIEAKMPYTVNMEVIG